MRFEILIIVVIVALVAGEVGAVNHFLIEPTASLLNGINGTLTALPAAF